MTGRPLSRPLAFAFACTALSPLPFAFAQGGAAPEPPAHPAAPRGVATTLQEGEGEGDVEHPAPVPTTKPSRTVVTPVPLKDGMVRIPGGRYTMGAHEGPKNERPAHSVIVAPFWLDRTEVTVGAYRACAERGGCAALPRTSVSCTYDAGDPQLPISCVPWSAAHAFCVAAGKRLPREVEWEAAARGTYAYRYPWGGGGGGCSTAVTLMHERTQRSCGRARPTRVGTHPAGASPYGVLDMSGNVEEWVDDWYAESLSDLSPRAGTSHVLRGGGWLSPPSLSRATSRNWGSVQEAGPNVGFRCARDD